jgi:hypothetical protein
LLPNRLEQRIAEAISHTIEQERASADTASPAWRQRCEVAPVATYGDSARRVFLSHIAERRAEAAAHELDESASELRTTAFFFLARKPS